MNRENDRVVLAKMQTRTRSEWKIPQEKGKSNHDTKRLLRNISFSAAAVFVLGIAGMAMLQNDVKTTAVMNQVTADFDYDETLGRLQFVSNILPESAMVFLESDADAISVCAPTDSKIVHAWNQAEPWIEYAASDDVRACSDGEVMAVIKNRDNEFTIRMNHENGYESLYSGLINVNLKEADRVLAGELLGYSNGVTAFEMRKDGMSILPEFSDL